MYLLDTNVILELLLEQDRAAEVEQFLRSMPPEQLYLSEFTLYSLGIILFRHKRYNAFLRMVQDLLVIGGVRMLHLGQLEMRDIASFAQTYDLDFDDAYQYAAAERHDLTIVSFDADFDRTGRGRRTPEQILAG